MTTLYTHKDRTFVEADQQPLVNRQLKQGDLVTLAPDSSFANSYRNPVGVVGIVEEDADVFARNPDFLDVRWMDEWDRAADFYNDYPLDGRDLILLTEVQ